MFISKFWILLLALVAGTMLAVILLAKDVVNRERAENATAILFKEMTKSDVALKLHARKRLDVLLSIAVDPAVRRMFNVASIGDDKALKTRGHLVTLLRKLNKDLGKYKADLLIALNQKGKVICQVGENERQHSYKLAGFPSVDAALRGFIRDDIWKLNNDIYLIATRPVIEQGRYVGALVHAMKVTDKVATDLSPSMQLAFYSGNVMAAVGTPGKDAGERAQGSYIAKPLDNALKSEKFKKDGYSEVEQIETPEGDFMAVYSRVRGEAAANNVGFALITSVNKMTSATEFYDKAGTQDVDALPKFGLILSIILAVLVGWGWTYIEGQRPITNLLKQIEALQKSDPKDQLNVYRYRRRIRKIATAINALIDYKIRALLDVPEGSSKVTSIDSILGKHEEDRLSSASFSFDEASASDVPPPPPLGDTKLPPAKEETPLKPPLSAVKKNKQPPAPEGPSKAGQPLAPLSPEQEQKEFRKIYEDFISLKKKLGEPVEQLIFERFLVTLKKNRDTLMARYDCRRVKFKVYEKEGKASLKATPVKE